MQHISQNIMLKLLRSVMPLSSIDFICRNVKGINHLELRDKTPKLAWLTENKSTPYKWNLEETGAYFVKYSELKKRKLI